MKKKLSICESLRCLDLVSFLVLNRIKPQAPLLVVQFRQSLHVSGLQPCSPQKHKTLIPQLDPSWFGLRLTPGPTVSNRLRSHNLSFLINENNSSQMFSRWIVYDKFKNSTCDNSTRVPSHIPIHHDLRKHQPTTQATCPILWVHANVLIHHTRSSEILEVPQR